jgi:hypothetical protein
MEVELHAFWNSTVDGSKWSASHPARFNPGERTPGTQLIRGRVGPRVGLDALAKRNIPCLCRESNPSRPARSLVLLNKQQKNKDKYGET